ncbi:MAG: DUF1501 domain-containing protein [Paracoccaceae bacterium]
MTMDRRAFLLRSGLVGCSLAASPLVTPVSFAAAPWEGRLVVIVLRGGMDGLDVLRPVGDPDFAALRDDQDRAAPHALDGFFALHPALSALLPLWQAGEFGAVHAVSTPYRDRRSHFDGQDLLEAGTDALNVARDGWLNRLLQAVPGIEGDTAYAIGRDELKLLAGGAEVMRWAPEADLVLSPQALRLAEMVMQDDPAFAAAFAQARRLAAGGDEAPAMAATPRQMAGQMEDGMRAARGTAAHGNIARFAADKLRGDARIAAFSLHGWDTHERQDIALPRALARLAETILALREDLGPVWRQTAVLAMTEFGRTARLNGTRGTDHGTGGAMLLAGGALAGGRVWTDWPGLAEADLYQRRDLAATRDLRAYAAWAMRGLFGLDRTLLERTVFPGLEIGADPGLIL